MRIKKLHIRNFKSLVDFQLENLPSFAAFVGPNASGKGNIFEALEFTNYLCRFPFEATSFFGGKQSIYSYNSKKDIFLTNDYQSFSYKFEDELKIKAFYSLS